METIPLRDLSRIKAEGNVWLAFAEVSVTIVQSSPPVRYFEPPQYDWLLLRLISNQGVDSHPGDLLTKILRNKKHLMRILSRNLSA